MLLLQFKTSRDAQYMPIFSHSLWPTGDADTDKATYFPPNCREHHVSPAVVVTYYYAYSYNDGLLADANIKYNAFQNVCFHEARCCLLLFVLHKCIIMIKLTALKMGNSVWTV